VGEPFHGGGDYGVRLRDCRGGLATVVVLLLVLVGIPRGGISLGEKCMKQPRKFRRKHGRFIVDGR